MNYDLKNTHRSSSALDLPKKQLGHHSDTPTPIISPQLTPSSLTVTENATWRSIFRLAETSVFFILTVFCITCYLSLAVSLWKEEHGIAPILLFVILGVNTSMNCVLSWQYKAIIDVNDAVAAVRMNGSYPSTSFTLRDSGVPVRRATSEIMLTLLFLLSCLHPRHLLLYISSRSQSAYSLNADSGIQRISSSDSSEPPLPAAIVRFGFRWALFTSIFLDFFVFCVAIAAHLFEIPSSSPVLLNITTAISLIAVAISTIYLSALRAKILSASLFTEPPSLMSLRSSVQIGAPESIIVDGSGVPRKVSSSSYVVKNPIVADRGVSMLSSVSNPKNLPLSASSNNTSTSRNNRRSSHSGFKMKNLLNEVENSLPPYAKKSSSNTIPNVQADELSHSSSTNSYSTGRLFGIPYEMYTNPEYEAYPPGFFDPSQTDVRDDVPRRKRSSHSGPLASRGPNYSTRVSQRSNDVPLNSSHFLSTDKKNPGWHLHVDGKSNRSHYNLRVNGFSSEALSSPLASMVSSNPVSGSTFSSDEDLPSSSFSKGLLNASSSTQKDTSNGKNVGDSSSYAQIQSSLPFLSMYHPMMFQMPSSQANAGAPSALPGSNTTNPNMNMMNGMMGLNAMQWQAYQAQYMHYQAQLAAIAAHSHVGSVDSNGYNLNPSNLLHNNGNSLGGMNYYTPTPNISNPVSVTPSYVSSLGSNSYPIHLHTNEASPHLKGSNSSIGPIKSSSSNPINDEEEHFPPTDRTILHPTYTTSSQTTSSTILKASKYQPSSALDNSVSNNCDPVGSSVYNPLSAIPTSTANCMVSPSAYVNPGNSNNNNNSNDTNPYMLSAQQQQLLLQQQMYMIMMQQMSQGSQFAQMGAHSSYIPQNDAGRQSVSSYSSGDMHERLDFAELESQTGRLSHGRSRSGKHGKRGSTKGRQLARSVSTPGARTITHGEDEVVVTDLEEDNEFVGDSRMIHHSPAHPDDVSVEIDSGNDKTASLHQRKEGNGIPFSASLADPHETIFTDEDTIYSGRTISVGSTRARMVSASTRSSTHDQSRSNYSNLSVSSAAGAGVGISAYDMTEATTQEIMNAGSLQVNMANASQEYGNAITESGSSVDSSSDLLMSSVNNSQNMYQPLFSPSSTAPKMLNLSSSSAFSPLDAVKSGAGVGIANMGLSRDQRTRVAGSMHHSSNPSSHSIYPNNNNNNTNNNINYISNSKERSHENDLVTPVPRRAMAVAAASGLPYRH